MSPLIRYQGKNFGPAALEIIDQANEVLEAYEAEGYDLTLRQLFYQFVSRDWIANTVRDYKRLGDVVNDARLAGMIDWGHIVDRTRNLRLLGHWNDPQAAIRDWTERYFNTDKWADHPCYVECWIEKDALVGVLQRVCNELDVPYFSCRGYTSQSEMWGAAQRLGEKIEEGKKVRILHLGDHDPSGIDMTRDIQDRLWQFVHIDWLRGRHCENGRKEERRAWMAIEDREERLRVMNELVRPLAREMLAVDRLALNMDQVDEYDPPPNPAKLTDARARGYIALHGGSSWELDALPPTVIGDLIRASIGGYLDHERWNAAVEKEEQYKGWLKRLASSDLDEVMRFLEGELSEEDVRKYMNGEA